MKNLELFYKPLNQDLESVFNMLKEKAFSLKEEDFLDIEDLFKEFDFHSIIRPAITEMLGKYLKSNELERELLKQRLASKGHIALAAEKGLVLSYSFRTPFEYKFNRATTSSRHIIHRVLSGEIDYQPFLAPAEFEPEIYKEDIYFSKLPAYTAKTDDIISIQANNIASVIVPNSPVELISLTSKPHSRFEHTIDSKTLKAVYMAYSDLDDGILCEILSLSATQLSSDDVQLVLPYLKHPNYRVRWECIKTAIQLDHKLAEKLLHQAINDQHPAVKNVAKKINYKFN